MAASSAAELLREPLHAVGMPFSGGLSVRLLVAPDELAAWSAGAREHADVLGPETEALRQRPPRFHVVDASGQIARPLWPDPGTGRKRCSR